MKKLGRKRICINHLWFGLLTIFLNYSYGVQKNFGIGVVIGEPTGILFNYGLSSSNRLNFSMGWGYNNWNNRYSGYYNDIRCDDRGYYRNNTSYCNNDYYRYNDNIRTFHLHGDYLIHNFKLIPSKEKFFVFYGPGVAYNHWFRGENELGIRGILGFGWTHRRHPFDLFIELSPMLTVLPGMWLDMNAGLGGRFYF